jgi:hydroxysqualene synthase
MTTATEAASGKMHGDENFPVASQLIQPRHRGVVLAFYRFARAADDVADHAALAPEAKLALLDRLEQTLLGHDDGEPDALPLRAALAERNLDPRHAQDLLTAFRLDVTKLRYRDWDDLMDYCRFSAMPVGRFVLDVHGESNATWPASDALCSALQVINHLQDCAADFRNLNRVYIPLDTFAEARLTPEVLGQRHAPQTLRTGICGLAARTVELLYTAAPLSAQVADNRLGLEIAVILRLAWTLTGKLQRQDPLSQRVHLDKSGFVAVTALGLVQGLTQRLMRALRAAPTRSEIP